MRYRACCRDFHTEEIEVAVNKWEVEAKQLRKRVAELEAQLAELAGADVLSEPEQAVQADWVDGPDSV